MYHTCHLLYPFFKVWGEGLCQHSGQMNRLGGRLEGEGPRLDSATHPSPSIHAADASPTPQPQTRSCDRLGARPTTHLFLLCRGWLCFPSTHACAKMADLWEKEVG